MGYWKYRAFDAQLRIQEGVIISHIDNNPDLVMLQLRQQGLQGVELKQIDGAEYQREVYLQRLRDRGRRQSNNLNFSKSGTHPLIRQRVSRTTRLISRLFTGRNS